ncbi:hypothetical protein [Virgibacillus proomii]|uniref:hypothetical protein n=1 Tax=Virgibacillus proomii TaxID=84407 RepID=UPI001C10C67F|nr:hypothetical protein [Virgibacillus proomii]MBU5266892.1 hypothetical protein [Virgibacillus proomii]
MKQLLIIMSFSFFLVSCSIKDLEENESVVIDKEQKNIFQVTEEFAYLEASSEVVDNSSDFDFAVVFEPDEKQEEEYNGMQDDFTYIKLDEEDEYVKGTVIVENKTKEAVKLENIFFQGNDKQDIFLEGKIYNEVHTITPPNKTTKLKVEIPFNIEKDKEISFFPKKEDELNTNLLRFFVTNEAEGYNKKHVKTETFNIKEEDYEKYDLLPTIDILNNDENLIDIDSGDNDFSKIRINKTLYDINLDIVILNSKGEKILMKMIFLLRRNMKK